MAKRGIHRHQKITSKIDSFQSHMARKEMKTAREFEEECRKKLEAKKKMAR